MLFRPGTYRRLAEEGHHACQVASRVGAAALERMQLKDKLKRMIRNASASHGDEQDTGKTQSDE
jgi:hypothetical protein